MYKSLCLDQDLFHFMAIFQYIFPSHITNWDGEIVPLICSPHNVHLMQAIMSWKWSENNFLETVSCWQRQLLSVNTQHINHTLKHEVQQWKYYSQWVLFLIRKMTVFYITLNIIGGHFVDKFMNSPSCLDISEIMLLS